MKSLKKVFILLFVAMLSFINIVKADNLVNPEISFKLDKYELQNGEEVTLTAEWSLWEAKSGDQFIFRLPEQFRNVSKPMELLNENRRPIAISHRDGDNIVFTFNEQVEGLQDLHGTFWLTTRLEIMEELVSGKEELIFEINGETTVIEIEVNDGSTNQPSVNDRHLLKQGYYNQDDMDIINWVIEINGNNELQANTIIKDRLKDGHKLIEESLSVHKQIGSEYVEQPYTTLEINGNGYEIEVYLDSTIVIYYDTVVTQAGIDHENTVTVTTWNDITYIDEAVAYDYDTGGTGSGVKQPIEEPEVEEPIVPVEPETNDPIVEDEPKEKVVKEPTVEEEVVEADEVEEVEETTEIEIPNTSSKGSYLFNVMVLLTAMVLLKKEK